MRCGEPPNTESRRLAFHGWSFRSLQPNVLFCGGLRRRLLWRDAGGPSAGTRGWASSSQALRLLRTCEQLPALADALAFGTPRNTVRSVVGALQAALPMRRCRA